MFNKLLLRTQIVTFLKQLTNNIYFLPQNPVSNSYQPAFLWYDKNVRPTKADCAGKNLVYAYVDGRVDTATSNTTNQSAVRVRIGVLRSEQEIMGVTSEVFDNTWSRFQTYLSQNQMRTNFVDIDPVLGLSPPFTYGDFGIYNIRNFGGDSPTEIGKCGALRYEMILEFIFDFNNNH